MKTVKLAGLWTIRMVAEALEVPVDEILNKIITHGAPPTISKNSTLDDDLAKLIALKYCCYLEREDERSN